MGRAWRDAAARKRRRAVLAGFGSAVEVSVDISSSLLTTYTEKQNKVKEEETEQRRDDATTTTTPTSPTAAAAVSSTVSASLLECDDLAAVSGAASWAIRLLLAPGSGEVRAEAASLIRHVAADGEMQR